MAGHAAAVVAVKKYNRVSRKAVLFQLLEDRAYLNVHRRDTIIKARQLATDQRRVRIVRRHRHLLRIMNSARRQRALHLLLEACVLPHHRAALMRGHQVEHAKEWLRLVRPLAPVGGGAAFVPRGLDDIRVIARVVIGLNVVARVKPLLPQQRRKPAHAFGNRKARAHLLRGQ